MERTLFQPEHDEFRAIARTYCEREVVPFHEEWEKAGIAPREAWLAAGKQGLLGMGVPEQYGGMGTTDFRYNVALVEEMVKVRASALGFALHNDIVQPYLLDLTTDEQKARWLPGFVTGELITAIAMTEPGAGSDLQGVRTTARLEGDEYVIDGQKTFITNGINADLVIVVAKTDPSLGARGTSLIVVERGTPGFERGRNLDKIGQKGQDTSELFFSGVRVPASNLLGEVNGGFIHLMNALPQERLSIAVVAAAAAENILELTMQYCRDRTAFGRPIGKFQATRFTLAEMATEVQVARTFVDRCIELHVEGKLTIPEAAMAKWWVTELQKRVVDTCLQLHGGYGYMTEYPVAQAYLDSRVQTIYGGTTEIMKEIIGRSLGF